MPDTPPLQASDREQRLRALDVSASFIVQAPAGSGKTELLIQRCLALLAQAELPEEILAITFTRKAAGEMKSRLLAALSRAGDDTAPEREHDRETWQLARAALARDRALGWGILANPTRLQVQTIDSFCTGLVRRMPWLSRFGECPGIADDPGTLYRAAAEQLVARVDGSDDTAEAVALLLAHLDNRLALLRDLLVDMLARRDQWLRHLLDARGGSPRPLFEESLRSLICQELEEARVLLGDRTCAELVRLGKHAAGNLEGEQRQPFEALLAWSGALPAETRAVAAWQGLAHLLLTNTDQLRSPRGIDRRLGFPADKTSAAQAAKEDLATLLEALAGEPRLVPVLVRLRRLPRPAFADDQWLVLAALVQLLPLAVVELREVFRREGRVDFIELAGAARAALGEADRPEDLLLQLDARLRHVLVDEFQDTSLGQYQLLERLTAGWSPGDGRTLFLVGDPMQSIYRFREAEVGLYLRARRRGLGDFPLARLDLNANFRSRQGLVDWCNRLFGAIFPGGEDEVRGAVTHAPSRPVRPPRAGVAVTTEIYLGRQDEREAARVVELVRAAGEGRVAILVRSRAHLCRIVEALKRARIPFQAQEIDPLAGRPVIQDLRSLTRGLLHLGDRVAWLAILRAPWCGLSLADLLALAGSDRGARTVWQQLAEGERQPALFGLSAAGELALARIQPVLGRALAQRGRVALARLVEATWLSLGGPACVTASELEDAAQFFALLERLDQGGRLARLEELDERLGDLHAAPDPLADGNLQLMTIHKAKGLEFDHVILPGLGRSVSRRERTLLRWFEHPDHGLLLAPIPPPTGDEDEPTYRALGTILQEKDACETLRLFYVAATRARESLHLLGHVGEGGEDGPGAPAAGSLLAAAWSALADEAEFLAAPAAVREPAAAAPAPLRRLPGNWSPPPLAATLTSSTPVGRRASDAAHGAGSLFPASLQTEEGRIVGTVVHAWLERFAREGLTRWTPERLASIGVPLAHALGAAGIPASRLEACCERTRQCLARTLASTRGRWILTGHPEAACELALAGVVAGEMVQASIDRTFVADGIRWVIDFKTSVPSPEEAEAEFLARERLRYQPQLELYVALLRLLEPGRCVRAALYFPAVDLWTEIPSLTP